MGLNWPRVVSKFPALDDPGWAFQTLLQGRDPLAKERLWRVISSVVERFVHIEDVRSSNLLSPTILPTFMIATCLSTVSPNAGNTALSPTKNS